MGRLSTPDIQEIPAGELVEKIAFNEQGLVPTIAQDHATGDVLMLAWQNRDALEKTLETGLAHYFSRSRDALWKKGETSGHYQHLRELRYDCDADAVLMLVEQTGVACHTGTWSCFFHRAETGGEPLPPAGPRIVEILYDVLLSRKGADPAGSYVASLYAKGMPGIADKVREEATELIEAGEGKDDLEVVKEFADLLFHAMVLLGHRGIDLDQVFTELGRRFGTSGHVEKAARKRK